MVIALRDLTTLDPAAVLQAQDASTALIVENNPALDLRFGPLFEILVYWHSVLAAQQGANVADYQSGRSLLAIQADPALADPTLVDDVLSNFRVTRLEGTQAHGEVTIVVTGNTTVTIGVGAVFQAAGQQFTVDQTFTAKSDPAQINSPSDRLFTATADGRYAFTITVTAVLAGVAGKLTRNTTIVPSSLPPGYVTSFVTSDFAGGIDTETNDALIARLQQGVAARDLSSRSTMNALLRNTEATSGFIASSIVGYGDPEMLRDRHSIFPIASGGRVDWYVRTQLLLDRVTLTRTATLVTKNGDGFGTWQVTLPRDDSAGVYEVATVRPSGTVPGNVLGGFAITRDTRGLDLTGTGFVPDLATTIEGVFSRFQTITLQFVDTQINVDNTALGATRDYDLELARMPLIDVIQSLVSARDTRHSAADCLAKAPMPCFVQVALTVYKQSGALDPDLASMRDAIATAINNTGFTGRLYASTLQDAVAPYIQAPTALSRLDLLGRLRYPTLETRWLRSAEVLAVPQDPANMIGSRTVQFYTAPADVAITVATAIPSES